MQIQGGFDLIDDFPAGTKKDRDSRMQRLAEEFNHPENQPFFTEKDPIECVICEMLTRKLHQEESLQELARHTFDFHGEEHVDLIIWIEEAILDALLWKKRNYSNEHGVFSN